MLEYKGVFAKACSFPMVLFYSLEKKYILEYSTSVVLISLEEIPAKPVLPLHRE